MTSRILLAAFLALSLSGCIGSCRGPAATRQARPAGDAAEDFKLLDHRGDAHFLYRYKTRKAVVIISQQNGCTAFREAAPGLETLRKTFEGQGVLFLMINAQPSAKREEIRRELASLGLDWPVLLDQSQLISESLGFGATPEAVVILPAKSAGEAWPVAYRGDALPGAGQGALSEAIRSVVDGKTPAAGKRGGGTPIAYVKADELTWVQHAGPVFKERCLYCHTPGLYPPNTMNSYEQIRGWGPMIREVVRKGIMPPWNVDSHYAAYVNDSSMTPAETRTLVRWIETGMKRGEGEDPLSGFQPDVEQAKLSKPKKPSKPQRPDMVLEMDRAVTIPADGFEKYLFIPVGKPFKEERWIRAIKMDSTNPKTIHHASLLVVPPRLQKQLGSPDEGKRTAAAMAYTERDVTKTNVFAPGREDGVRMPRGVGAHVPKGGQIVLEMHYSGTGKVEEDRSGVKLFFYPKDAAKPKKLRSILLRNTRLTVPPGVKDYRVDDWSKTLDREIHVLTLFPHMHYRGKSARIWAELPDGGTEMLLSIPTYDFGWQKGFTLADPKRLPKGTRLKAECVYDNSVENPLNPDPNAEVPWGQTSERHEMCNMNVIAYED